jgi:hypothetical protein
MHMGEMYVKLRVADYREKMLKILKILRKRYWMVIISYMMSMSLMISEEHTSELQSP